MSQDYSQTRDSPPPPYNEKHGMPLATAATNYGYIPNKQDTNDIVISADDIDVKDDALKTVANVEIEEEEDPWKISNVYVEVTPWSELSTCGKFKRVVWDYFGKVVLLIGFLYLFICSLDFLSNAFKLIGGKAAGKVFAESQLLANPVAGLMIGILATVLLQSSSTTTSIVVSMVAAKIIPLRNAIPMVMGANIGTSVTNTLVSIGQITTENDFRRAFAGATVHDMFNWLTVIILLPLESITGYLFHLTEWMVNKMHLQTNEGADQEFLKVITHPFTHLIIQVDKKVIQDVAHGIPEAMNKSMIKHCCAKEDVEVIRWNTSENWNQSYTSTESVNWNTSGSLNASGHWNFSYTATESVCLEKCRYLFENVANTWSDATVGIVLLVIALAMLCICLVLLVKTLNSLLKGKVSLLIKKFVNANFPGVFAYFTGYLAIIVGTGLTILVQSSSVFTSALTPLVGIGVVSIDRMYPLTLGANIGTTTTAILAALAQSAEDIPLALQISLCHLFFNISGILLFFPIPQLRFPIRMAKFLGNQTAKYRWFAVVYLILGFFILPGAVFGLSLVSWKVMAGVCSPLAFLLLLVVVINILQSKAPQCLPPVLRTWKFLPEPLRSLKPIDRMFKKLKMCCPCCSNEKNESDAEALKNADTTEGEKSDVTKF